MVILDELDAVLVGDGDEDQLCVKDAVLERAMEGVVDEDAVGMGEPDADSVPRMVGALDGDTITGARQGTATPKVEEDGTLTCPQSLLPQQVTPPGSDKEHECICPTATATCSIVDVDGTFDCPATFQPQHLTTPISETEHV